MNRPLKFRAWNTIHGTMSNSFTLLDCINDTQVFMLPENFAFMQYTGLKDKHGVEIYEGDILRGKTENRSVEWNDGTLNLVVSGGLMLWAFHEPEVIGNIYENPELLERSAA